MRKCKIISGFAVLFLLCLCANSWPAEDRIAALQKQISVLEEQKGQLESEKQTLIAEGDKLSYKIEALKIQAKSGLGIIGRYKLSQNLRKAQALSEKIQTLEKKVHETENELKDKRGELEREYERQITILLEKLNGISLMEERRAILEKVREYQAAKKRLVKPEREEPEHLDVTKVEIKEYDGPQEIREKADLISDFANKMSDRAGMLTARIEKLRKELKTRKRLGEFAEEISFFGERIAKEEIVSDSGKTLTGKPVEKPAEEPVATETDTSAKDAGATTPITETTRITSEQPIVTEQPQTTTEQPVTTAAQPSAPSGKIVLERNGVSAEFAVISLDQIEKEIRLLEKRRQDLKKEISTLSEKANSFYKKADEIEKSETKTGGKKR